MNTSGDNIIIVTVCDNHFAVHLAALIKSVEINHLKDELIDFYIVEDNILQENRERLERTATGSKLRLKWLDINKVIPDNITLPRDNSSFPLNVYTRLFIPYFVPGHLKKVLYLDVDMVVLADVTDLWSIDLSEKIIAGVVDRSETVSSNWGGITNYKALNLSPDTKYFNSGLLLIKPKEWRDAGIPAQIIAIVEKHKQFANFPDQYGLNVVFAGEWFELDRRWNSYSTGEISDPFVIHFTGRKPIFSSYNYNPGYKKEFFKYLDQTEWKGYRPISELKRLQKKLYNKIVKMLLPFLKK